MTRKSQPRLRRNKPLWRCKRCGKYYVTANMWHACARHTIEEHFRNRDAKLKLLFNGIVGLLKRNGPLRVVPGKTRIAFQVRMRFGGVHVRKAGLDLAFVLPRRIESARIRKIVAHSPRSFGHYLSVETPADLDAELVDWLRESYTVGQQAELFSGRKKPLRVATDLSWSQLYEARVPRSKSDGHPNQSMSAGTLHTARRRSVWKCPKCGRRFPVQNQIHICSRLTLKQALKGKSPYAVALFRKLVGEARRCGPIQIVPQKTRVALQASKIFLGVRFLRDAIDCELAFRRRVEHPRFRQILSASPGLHYHNLRLSWPREIDRDVRRWLREAYEGAR